MSYATADADGPIPPIFVFGFERSGTTLLSMMLGAHPQLAVPLSVTGLWYRYAKRLHDYNDLESANDVENLVDDLLAEVRIRLWDVDLCRDAVLDGLEPGDFAAVVSKFHFLYAQQKDKPYWGNVDVATLCDMNEMHRLFPDARFLHIVRDGRDVALSHQTYKYGVDNIVECAERWSHELRMNLKMGSIIGPRRYQIVHYEDLILRTVTTLEQICAFAGIPYSPAMLDYPRMVDGKVPENRRALWPAINKPPVKSRAYRWKTGMSRAQRVAFEGVANDMLGELGYEAYDQVPKYLPGYAYEFWCFLGRGGRFKRLAKKFGVKQ